MVDANVVIFERLTGDEWECRATHGEFGGFGTRILLQRGAEHGHDHAEQIKRCRP
jgi:hypothetical protein